MTTGDNVLWKAYPDYGTGNITAINGEKANVYFPQIKSTKVVFMDKLMLVAADATGYDVPKSVFGFKFDAKIEQQLIALIKEKRQPRTTADPFLNQGAHWLRPKSFDLNDSVDAAAADANTIIRLAVKLAGGKKLNINGTDYLYEFERNGQKYLWWFRTAQQNGGQDKAWKSIREQLQEIYPTHTIMTTTYFDRPPDAAGLITHTVRQAWEALTGSPHAYDRILELGNEAA